MKTPPQPKAPRATVYHISPGYRSVTAWEGNKFGERLCRSSCVPFKRFDRRMRYSVICGWLKKWFKLPAPVYVPTKREAVLASANLVEKE